MTTLRATTLLAALSGTTEANAVLNVAIGIGRLLGSEVEAVHVSEETERREVLAKVTTAADVRLRERHGPVAEQILEALKLPQMLGLVMGTRTFIAGPRPAGNTALQVLRATIKPVVFVPPEVVLPSVFTPHRLLVPLDGSTEASSAFLELESLFRVGADLEVMILYTLDGLTPSMLDRPEYDLPLWGSEFVLRHCPGEHRSFEWRTGNPANAVIEVADHAESDLIVLSFGGDIDVGHGAVIREVLARSTIPVLVLPVSRVMSTGAGGGAGEPIETDLRGDGCPDRRTAVE